METQNQIKQTLTNPEAIEYINTILDTSINRTALADALCDHFCLPESTTGKSPRKLSPRRLDKPVPMPEQVPERAGNIKGLSLVIVQTEEEINSSIS